MSRRNAVFDGIGLPQPTEPHSSPGGLGFGMEKARLAESKRQHDNANKKDLLSDIDKTYDPNANLSGTIYDPTYSKGIADLKDRAYKMAQDGADGATIQAALSKDANQLNLYSLKAKTIRENLDKNLAGIPANSGYLKDKVRQRALENALLDENGQLKDMNLVDEKQDYISNVLSQNPAEVTDSSGLSEFVKDSMVNAKPTTVETKTYNSKGGYEKKKLKITAPDWMVLDIDDKGRSTRDLVPKFEIATEDGAPIISQFKDPKTGNIVDAPVRLVDEGLFNHVLKNSPSYSDNLRGQVMKHIQEGDYKDENGNPIALNSPQAKNLARALMYNDLKMEGKGGVEDIVETKPTQIKNITNVNTGRGSGSDAAINDLYSKIQKKVDTDIDNLGGENKEVYTRVNALGTDAASIIVKTANDLMPDAKLSIADLFLHKDNNGEINIYQLKKDGEVEGGKVVLDEKYKIGTLPKVGTNLKVQPNTKAKVEVVKQGDAKKTAQPARHKAKMPDGSIITSSDGVTWYYKDGKKVE